MEAVPEKAVPEKAPSKAKGLKDEVLGALKEVGATIVCNGRLKQEGKEQRKRGKREILSAKAKEENLTVAHLPGDENKGFFGSENKVPEMPEELKELDYDPEKKAEITGVRVDDPLNVHFANQHLNATHQLPSEESQEPEDPLHPCEREHQTKDRDDEPRQRKHAEPVNPIHQHIKLSNAVHAMHHKN